MVDYKGFQDNPETPLPSFDHFNEPATPEEAVPEVTEASPLNSQSPALEAGAAAYRMPKKRQMAAWIAVIMVAAILTGTAAGVGYQWAGTWNTGGTVQGAYFLDASTVKNVSSNYGLSESIPDMVDRLGGAVVSITSTMVQNDLFYNEVEASGSGTGVVFNKNKDSILIVTNNHVIEDATQLSVAFDRQTSAKATVVGTDPDSDIAVIKVMSSDIPAAVLAKLPTVVFGDSDKLRVGELAVAIGNPLGYDDTVTVGVVSGIDRSLRLSGRNFNLIQTDAAINPGNSGGALFNSKGEVIGINTVKISDQEVEGIGFAIPINTVKPLIKEILEKGYVSKPYLGIAGQDITKEISENYNLPVGVMVSEVVPGSGAQKAGLVRGDIITKVDGKAIESMEQLIDMISAKKIGDTITLTVKGEDTPERTVKAVLGDKNKR